MIFTKARSLELLEEAKEKRDLAKRQIKELIHDSTMRERDQQSLLFLLDQFAVWHFEIAKHETLLAVKAFEGTRTELQEGLFEKEEK